MVRIARRIVGNRSPDMVDARQYPVRKEFRERMRMVLRDADHVAIRLRQRGANPAVVPKDVRRAL